MADQETVITHLQIVHTWAAFARERDLQFFTRKHLEDIEAWSKDAIDLLKKYAELEERHKILVDKCDDMYAMLKEQEEQIDYVTCAKSLALMWRKFVLSDSEYNRIMDNLNWSH